jgi:hypothetical protein
VSESKISRADLEAKFREVQTELTSTAEKAKGKVLVAAGGAFVVLVLLVYLLGRRSGKKRSTVVEIRRL